MCIEKRIEQMEKELEQTKKIAHTIDLVFSIAITAIALFVAIGCPLMLN